MGFSDAAAARPGLLIAPLAALILMALEYAVARLTKSNAYDLGETAASLVIAIGHRVTTAATAGIAGVPMQWIFEHRLFEIPPYHPASLAALFLGVEFCYYWHHVAMHKVRWFWATHAVHHSATKLNLTAAIRLGWGSNVSGGFLFYLPLVWLGFAPAAVFATMALGLFYQFFLHTAHSPRLGPLEWVLNTPRHHHVHHASNEACLDRNFGSVLIVFDRLFGSFAPAPADEPLRYGLKGSRVPTRQPFAAALAGWGEIVRGLYRAGSWRGRWQALFGPPAAPG
jgi:sterol desaturase/sphingolipid hydroxylase (fatty acid hydroxylase superfamily)